LVASETQIRASETQRLRTLRSYDALGPGRDKGLDALCGQLRRSLDVPMAAVSIVDETHTHLIGRDGVDTESVPNDQSFCALAIREMDGAPFAVVDALSDSRFRTNPFVTDGCGIRFYAAAPLIAGDGSALGCLCALDTRAREVTATERQTLVDLSRTAMQILEMRRHMQQARQLALTDDLTKLPNRTAIEIELGKAIAALDQRDLPFSLLRLDVDGIARINETKGQPAGDALLRLIGDALKHKTRRGETAGRLGGDDFALIILGADPAMALSAGRRIKLLLDKAVAAASYDVTFSMGLVTFLSAPADVAATMRESEARLLEAKRGGRNQIVDAVVGETDGRDQLAATGPIVRLPPI
jgi:diguanylate cyclase (GGDEF)-like protein